jgi:hypothetical protein
MFDVANCLLACEQMSTSWCAIAVPPSPLVPIIERLCKGSPCIDMAEVRTTSHIREQRREEQAEENQKG